jgi:hypothetical protein
VGYKGRGGAEYFKPEFSYAVEEGDIVGYVDKIIYVINLFETNPNLLTSQRKKASDFILQNYSIAHEIDDVINAWQRTLKRYNSLF